MAQKMDAFEAAMAAMNQEGEAEPADVQPTEADPFATNGEAASDATDDPFAAAMNAMDAMDTIDGDDAAAGTEGAVDPFNAAMEAMDGAESGDSIDIDSVADPFDKALEVAKTEHKVAEAQKGGKDSEQELDIDFLMEVKLTLTFEVGRAKMYITDLLSLGQGSVIELHRLVGEDLELFVNGRLLATGEVVVVNEKFGSRITKILPPDERLARLGPFYD